MDLIQQLEQEEIELKKAEMFLKAQGLQDKAHADVYKHELDLKTAEVVHGHNKDKTDRDFEHKATAILADLYKHETKLDHEKNIKSKEKAKE